MYRVLLVDDEPWILVGIRKSFKWAEMGFEIIAECENPVEAFDIITSEKPDVVFTDLRMPEISGLELIRKCRESGIESEFIIVSGFAEFEYAKEALKLGAFDYLLKPIQMDDTDELLKKLFLHLEERKHIRDLELFDLLLENRIQIDTVIKQSPSDKSFQAFVSVNCKDIKTVGDYFPVRDSRLELCLGMGKYLYVVCNCDSLNLSALQDDMIKNGINNIYIGASSISNRLEDVPRLVKEADSAVYGDFINNSQMVFNYKKTDYKRIKDLVKKIAAADASSPDTINSFFEALPGQFAEYGFGINDIVLLWNMICTYVIEKYDSKAQMEFDFMDYVQMKNRFGNSKELCEYLAASFLSLYETKFQQKNEADINRSFKELIEFLNGNFQKELHLVELSKKFFINLTYCCDLFKKYTGGTYSEYVAKLRMDKACELLTESRLTINEICSEVGYNDYYYFNKSFKKYKGLSPAKYRKIPRPC